MKRPVRLLLLLVALGALALRWPHLGERPFHTDESVHAAKFLGLWQTGEYRYDPHEYHGPTLYYVSLPFAWLSGAKTSTDLSESTLRLVPVLFGVSLVLLLALVTDGLGRGATVGAAAMVAVSPAFVFYSRYYIHEMLLVSFSLLGLGALWRYLVSGRVGWILLAGASLGLMHATKETFVLAVAAAVAGVLIALWWTNRDAAKAAGAATQQAGGTNLGSWRAHLAAAGLSAPESWRAWHCVAGLGMALAVSIVLFTSFFTNAAGPLDSIRTYAPWFGRAQGASPHIHPWSFYLERLGWFHPAKGTPWTEGFILGFAGLGLLRVVFRREPAEGEGHPAFLRWVAVGTLLLAAVYSGIGYKTPWCVLGFHLGFILLAGVGMSGLVAWMGRGWRRWAVMAVLLVGIGHLGWQAWQLSSGPMATDRRNPWVYAHTSRDIFRLLERVRELAAAAPVASEFLIKVIAPGPDYWPLPWYLRGFPRTEWYGEIPPDPYAPVMIVGAKYQAEFDEKSEKQWLMTGLYEHRPGVFFELYVQFDLWKRYIESRPRAVDDD